MYYLISDKGFYAGENEDRPRWMQGFKFSTPIDTYAHAFQIGLIAKRMGRIVFFEVLKDTETEKKENGR